MRVVDRKSDKTAITAANIERYFVLQGVLDGNWQEMVRSQKEKQTRQFVTESFFEAGPDFELDNAELGRVMAHLKEMDSVSVIELDPAKIKYAEGLEQVFRACEDPFDKELGELKFKSAQGAAQGQLPTN
mgnify:CR=1 FL=1